MKSLSLSLSMSMSLSMSISMSMSSGCLDGVCGGVVADGIAVDEDFVALLLPFDWVCSILPSRLDVMTAIAPSPFLQTSLSNYSNPNLNNLGRITMSSNALVFANVTMLWDLWTKEHQLFWVLFW